MAPVAPGIGLGTSIEEDPSEPTSDSEMTPEPEREAPIVTGDVGTFVANTMPAAASPTPIPPVESVSSFQHYHHYFGVGQFIAQFLGTTRNSVDRARDELESRPGCFGSQCPQAE
ncbi:hypothetical protein M9H77_08372 [Catharanthus roseus]|uniref:Uncharacterized protein n=1 Tax=Catharanthus roseus TaxID=4058 RepID=A0ACC0BXJ8_CATRO|nr:hypothetical protein M9H77_08372 [Catharanthus roseus]